MEFADHLWLPFIDQPHYDIVVFTIITIQVYKIIVTKCKSVSLVHDTDLHFVTRI